MDDPLERQAEQLANQVVPDRDSERNAAGTGQAAWIQATGRVPGIVHQVLGTSGHPMDAVSRAVLEPRFGRSFGAVRLHTDEIASRSAKALHSLAYTAGDHIVFASGQYPTARESDRRLLAHELVHTIQQGGRPLAVQRAPDPTAHPAKKKTHSKQAVVQVTWTNDLDPLRLRLIHALRRTPDFRSVPTHIIEEALITYGADDAFQRRYLNTFKPGQSVSIRVATHYYDPESINPLRDMTLTNWQQDSPVRQQEEEQSVNDRIVQQIVAADRDGWEGLNISIAYDGHKITGTGFSEVGPQQPRSPAIARLSEKAALFELSPFLDRATRRPGLLTGYFRRYTNGPMHAENEAIHHGLPESDYNRVVEVRTVEVTISSLRENAKSLEHLINDSNAEWEDRSSWMTGNARTSMIDYYDRMNRQDFRHIFLLLSKATAAVNAGNLPVARAMIAYCEPELNGLEFRFKAQQKDLQGSGGNSVQSAEKVKGLAKFGVSHLATAIGGHQAGYVADHLYGAVLDATNDIARHAYGLPPAPPADPLSLMQPPPLLDFDGFSKLPTDTGSPPSRVPANDNNPVVTNSPSAPRAQPTPVAARMPPVPPTSWSTNPPTASTAGGGQGDGMATGLLVDTDTMTSGSRARQVVDSRHPLFNKTAANDAPESQADAAAVPIAVGQRPRAAPTFVGDEGGAAQQRDGAGNVPAQMAKKPANAGPTPAPAPPVRTPTPPAAGPNRPGGGGGGGRLPAPVRTSTITPGTMTEAQMRAQMRVQRGTYVYIVSDETGALQKAGTSDNPFDRARSRYYTDSVYTHMRVVAGPMARPQALTAETMLSHELGEAGMNVRKNTITEMKGGADWEESIEHVRVYPNARPLLTITIPR